MPCDAYVDFLVGEEAVEHQEAGLVMLEPGVPIQIGGVPVDLVSIGEGESHLQAELSGEIAAARRRSCI